MRMQLKEMRSAFGESRVLNMHTRRRFIFLRSRCGGLTEITVTFAPLLEYALYIQWADLFESTKIPLLNLQGPRSITK